MRPFVALAAALASCLLESTARACEPDAALAEAAATLLADGGEVSPTRVVEVVRLSGSSAIAPRALVAPASDAATIARFVAENEAGDGRLVCGEAETEARRLVVVAKADGELRFVAAEPQRLAVRVASGFRPAYVVFRGRDGALVRTGLDAESMLRGVDVPADLLRPIDAQLVAEDPSGPRPVAELRIVTPPNATRVARGARVTLVEDEPSRDREATRVVASVTSSETRGDVDAVAILASMRRAHGEDALRANRILTTEAAAHARRVCESGQVAHQLEFGANPEARLRSRGLVARVVGETIARAESVSAAFAALEASPSHFAALVDRRFTDVGVGDAEDGAGRHCVVVMLAAWPRVAR